MGKRQQFKFKRPERPGIGQIWNLLSWMWINATLLFHCIAKYNGMQNSYIWAEFYGFRPIFSISVHNKLFTKLPFCFIVTSSQLLFCYQNCSYLLWEKLFQWSRKTFEIRGWRPRICKNFEITRKMYSNSERSEEFLVTECFFNLLLEVSHI